MSEKWWIAINGASSCAANLTFPSPTMSCTPTPRNLIGFPTQQEAADAQQFLLEAPVDRDMNRRLQKWVDRDDVIVLTFRYPEPPGTTTDWTTDDPIGNDCQVATRSNRIS